jgi:TRAP transporter 4TM/12TM fusion protein
MAERKDLEGGYNLLITLVGCAFALFYILTSVFGAFAAHVQRGMYFLFTVTLIFLVFPASRRSSLKKIGLLDSILIVLTIFSVGYWMATYYTRAMERMGEFTDAEIGITLVMIVIAFEVSRRVLGKTLTLLAAASVIYCYAGPYIPGVFGHKGFSLQRVIEYMGSTEGIFGVVIQSYASFVFLFIIFAAFLEHTGAGDTLIQLGNSLAGRFRGGPAKVAVVSSGLVGSIMGSGIANVTTTGSFTIPMMKRIGYKPHVAGAVEAAASTGGQFMPPVMGAGAFVLAAFTETPYIEICKMAAIPAILYYVSVLSMVHFEAVKTGMKRLPDAEIPTLRQTIKRSFGLVLTVGAILYVLMMGYSPNIAAITGILSVIFISSFRKETRLNLQKVIFALREGALDSLTVGATAGVVGIVIGAISISGLGIKISDSIINLAGGHLFLTIFFVAVAAYALGMSMTVVADYILVSALAVPALVMLGVPVVAAHLMIFWLVNSSGITPPVAVVAFAAAGIAKADPTKTGYEALKMSIALFVTPLIFVYLPDILYGSLPIRLMYGLSCAFGFICLSVVIQGYLLKKVSLLERGIMALATFCLFHPLFWTDLVGYALCSSILLKQWLAMKKQKIEDGQQGAV